jgi:hypothetical protein
LVRGQHGRTLLNSLKHPIDDVAKHSTKMVTPTKNKKQPMGMPLARPVPLKEKEGYELSNDEIFSLVRIIRVGNLTFYSNILIL